MPLQDVVENLLSLLKSATGVPVKYGWISSESPPLITVMQSGGGSEVLGASSIELRRYDFQVDVWARSARERDAIAEKILREFVGNWREKYLRHGWFSAFAYAMRDVEEEGAHRKIINIVVKEVVA